MRFFLYFLIAAGFLTAIFRRPPLSRMISLQSRPHRTPNLEQINYLKVLVKADKNPWAIMSQVAYNPIALEFKEDCSPSYCQLL